MSKNLTKVIAGLGVVAGLGAAMLPLGTYASNEATAALSVNVGSAISVALSDSVHTIGSLAANAKDETTMKDTVKVTTNNATGYILKAETTTSNNAMVASSNSIPALASEGPLNAGTAAWGIKIDNSGNFKPVPASGGAGLNIKESSAPANAEATQVNYGVATGTDQVSGNYQVSVKFTATTK